MCSALVVFGLLFAMVTPKQTFKGLVVQSKKMTNSITRAYAWQIISSLTVGVLWWVAFLPMVNGQ